MLIGVRCVRTPRIGWAKIFSCLCCPGLATGRPWKKLPVDSRVISQMRPGRPQVMQRCILRFTPPVGLSKFLAVLTTGPPEKAAG